MVNLANSSFSRLGVSESLSSPDCLHPSNPEYFQELRYRTRGLLEPAIYRRVYEEASSAQGDAIEVGTAFGSATIAIAKGLPKSFRVHSIDKISGGTAGSLGNTVVATAKIRKNFRSFGVDKTIDFYPGSSDEVAASILGGRKKFGLLMLDADGAIDRDFRLFYNSLTLNSPVIIDDYGPGPAVVRPKANRLLRIDQKKRLAALLVELFEEKGLIQRRGVLKETYFGFKPFDGVYDFNEINDRIFSIYRELVFSDGKKVSRIYMNVQRNFRRNAPKTYQRIKYILGRGLP